MVQNLVLELSRRKHAKIYKAIVTRNLFLLYTAVALCVIMLNPLYFQNKTT